MKRKRGRMKRGGREEEREGKRERERERGRERGRERREELDEVDWKIKRKRGKVTF
jgi:hypothetical protein